MNIYDEIRQKNIQSLEGQNVIIRLGYLKEELRGKFYNPFMRVFLCAGGSGCYEFTSGTGIFGNWVIDNEDDKLRPYWVERLATKEEIDKATEYYKKRS